MKRFRHITIGAALAIGLVVPLLGSNAAGAATAKNSPPVLRPGEKGTRVLTVRNIRRSIAQKRPITDATNAIYDAELVTWMKGFQRSKGLLADGIVGPQTWQQLYEAWEDANAYHRPSTNKTPNVTYAWEMRTVNGFERQYLHVHVACPVGRKATLQTLSSKEEWRTELCGRNGADIYVWMNSFPTGWTTWAVQTSNDIVYGKAQPSSFTFFSVTWSP